MPEQRQFKRIFNLKQFYCIFVTDLLFGTFFFPALDSVWNFSLEFVFEFLFSIQLDKIRLIILIVDEFISGLFFR